MVDANGNREHLHDTPLSHPLKNSLGVHDSHTIVIRSYTPRKTRVRVRSGQAVGRCGPAWSSLSLSTAHKQRSHAPLCKNGRSRGHTIIHDFTLGPNAIEPYMFSWAGIWTEQSRNRGSSNATPRQRKTKKVEEDGKKVDGEVEDSVDEEEEGGREEGTVGEGGTADRFGEDDEDVFPLEGGGDDDE
ncbi:hypothetical protein A1F94_005624 [Pyrenophora tritici-repentis]|nr:hypothetical protein A1F94_005624 [Pyrenophora tritici-repentis]